MLPRVITLVSMLLLSVNAFSSTCLKFSTEDVAEEALRSLIPLEASHKEVMGTLSKVCTESDVTEHFYQDSPVIVPDGTEVWSWVKISEGPYRFIRRLFLKTYVVATIRFDKQGEVIAHAVELQTDSL